MSSPVDIEQDYDDETVILNIGGLKYEVKPSTLAQYPNTLLGQMFHPSNRQMRKPDKKGEYFFDRNGRVFEVVLNFYRTGKLVIPQEMPQELVREELKYFKIEYSDGAEENEDDKILKLPKDQIFSYAQSLIHNSSKYDIKRGLFFFQQLKKMEPESYLYRYSIAYACYRLGLNKEGIEQLEEILSTDPHNPQARSLLVLFADNRISNARIGIIVCVLIAVGVFGFFKIRNWYKLASLVTTSIRNGSASAVPHVVNAIKNNQDNVSQVAQNVVNTTSRIIEKASSVANNAASVASEAATTTATTASPSTVAKVAHTTGTVAYNAAKAITSSNIQPVSAHDFLGALDNSIPDFKK
ncbi:hypothetical protein CYY_007677 [Polysphondylium violaceum]|uniref:BTB domain-containing protein n=1 Tax=Polysphondylium violaceum TaxID=133409 RepID=A0A8J4PQG2_9MYCE|nr:hypothetical protein CYY_007677 [Polysphondylium violaceum]